MLIIIISILHSHHISISTPSLHPPSFLLSLLPPSSFPPTTLSPTLPPGCCCLHRRHLMVWAVFAPKFAFEGDPPSSPLLNPSYLPPNFYYTTAIHGMPIIITTLHFIMCTLSSFNELLMLSSLQCSINYVDLQHRFGWWQG